jgi:hypothetical protein
MSRKGSAVFAENRMRSTDIARHDAPDKAYPALGQS